MPQRLFLDNWTSFLEAPAAAAAATLTVGSAAAARLVGLADGNYYPLTLSRIEPVEGQMRETAWEIVHITAKAGGVLTVLRGQEGTTARDWLEGEMVSVRMTAAALAEIYARLAAVEAAIPPPPEVNEFEISLLVADSIYGSFGWDTTSEYPGSSATPSVLAFGGDIGTVPLIGIFVLPGTEGSSGSFYLKVAHEFVGTQLVSITAAGVGTFTGASAVFFGAAGGESTWEWTIETHDWVDGATRAISLTFDL